MKFLSICVKCNGQILDENDWAKEESTFLAAQRQIKNDESTPADGYIPHDTPLFMCSNSACRQIYWYSAGESSSSTRSKVLAQRLFSLIKASETSTFQSKPESKIPTEDTSVAAACYRTRKFALNSAKLETAPRNLVTSAACNPSAMVRERTLRHELHLRSLYSLEDNLNAKAGGGSYSHATLNTPYISSIRNGFSGDSCTCVLLCFSGDNLPCIYIHRPH